MYPKLILRNVFRNLQTYTIYFLSLILIYSLLYAFNALPSHPVMQSLSGAKVYGAVILFDTRSHCLSHRLLNEFCYRETGKRAWTLCNAWNEKVPDYWNTLL